MGGGAILQARIGDDDTVGATRDHDQPRGRAGDGRPGAVRAGILIGGRSARMGRPKHLLEVAGETLLDRVARALEPQLGRPVLLGDGPLDGRWHDATRLADPPGLAGPIAGLVAAMRWDPGAAWLLASCDLVELTADAVAWVLGQRRGDRWVVFPSLDGRHPEPMLALYEAPARPLVEAAAHAGGGPARLADHPRSALVVVPVGLRGAWRDVDHPHELDR